MSSKITLSSSDSSLRCLLVFVVAGGALRGVGVALGGHLSTFLLGVCFFLVVFLFFRAFLVESLAVVVKTTVALSSSAGVLSRCAVSPFKEAAVGLHIEFVRDERSIATLALEPDWLSFNRDKRFTCSSASQIFSCKFKV